jgi:uncharacterized membrane protein YidH (DUF202 family)
MSQRLPRPDGVFDPGLQHERTAMAWERTAISTMVAGTLLARWAAEDAFMIIAVFGVVQVAFGAGLLAWSGTHYDELHGPLRTGQNPSHPLAARVVGLATTAGIGLALVLAVVHLIWS